MIDSDSVISCSTNAFEEWDFDVWCQTCLNPTVAFGPNGDCTDGSNFSIIVDVSDMGSATELIVTDDQGTAPLSVTAAGSYTYGDYASTTDVVMTVNDANDVNCFVISNTISCLSGGPGSLFVNAGEDQELECDGDGCTEITATFLATFESITDNYNVDPITYDPPFAFNGLAIWVCSRVNDNDHAIASIAWSQLILSLSAVTNIISRLMGYDGPEADVYSEAVHTLGVLLILLGFIHYREGVGLFFNAQSLVDVRVRNALLIIGAVGSAIGPVFSLPEAWLTSWVNLCGALIALNLVMVIGPKAKHFPQWIIVFSFVSVMFATGTRTSVNLFDIQREPNSVLDVAVMSAIVMSAYLNGGGVLLEANRRSVSMLTRLSSLDPLTNLLNRRSFFDQARLIQQKSLMNGCYAFIYIDVDRFKAVNDKHGHSRGDDVLKHISQVLRSNLRHSDLITRLGGDEFAVFLPNTSEDDAKTVAESIRERMEFIAAESQLDTSLSLGVAMASYDVNIQKTLDRADGALYQAKSNGGNQVRVSKACFI